LVRGEQAEGGRFYACESNLAPLSDPPPEVWFGSWGSDLRLAAMAAVADGWFASAYNATPDQFAAARARLDAHIRAAGREPSEFSDAVATMWCYVTDSSTKAEQMLNDVLAPTLNRAPETLGDLPVGSPQQCAEAVAAYAEAGAREVLLWPLRDSLEQLELCGALLSAL
jgi:alkanesulfonate monooxygenase SsuD/methylene tetrahydromethanopterin reductase-like flavin-dependent oxidoreductase (luciferase family)